MCDKVEKIITLEELITFFEEEEKYMHEIEEYILKNTNNIYEERGEN
jgi:hypothetical protein